MADEAEPYTEVIDEGLNRLIVLGSSFEAIDGVMRFYFPNDNDRRTKYAEMLALCIDSGFLHGKRVALTPRNPEINLTDDSLRAELRKITEE